MQLFEVCLASLPPQNFNVLTALTAAKPIKTNKIKQEINTQTPKLSPTLSQGIRGAWLFLFELVLSGMGVLISGHSL